MSDRATVEYRGVSFICPYCLSQCGKDKYGEWDAIRIEDAEPGVMQYAHRDCRAETRHGDRLPQ